MNDSFATLYVIDVITPPRVEIIAFIFPVFEASKEIVFVGNEYFT